jgi:hypothetical protein
MVALRWSPYRRRPFTVLLFSSKTGLANTFYLFALFPKSTGYLRRALDSVLYFASARVFFSGSPTAGRVSEHSSPRISSKRLSCGGTYSTVVSHWHMYDILVAPRANSLQQRPRASDVPGTQFLVLSQPCHHYDPYTL